MNLAPAATPSPQLTTQPTVTPSQPPPPAKPKSLLSIGIIVLLLAALGYFGYQNWQLQQQVNRFNAIIKVDNEPYDFPSPSPLPSTDPTADWKTYTNTQYSFSFKYPTELAYLYDGIDQNGPLLIQNFDGLTSAGNQTNDFQITLYVSKDTTGKTLEQYANQTSSGDEQKVTIGSKDALKGFSIQKYEAVPSVWIQDGENFFLIQLSTAKSTNSAWFDQILSTFKFLDQPFDTSNWKIFNSFGITFMYPPDWGIDSSGKKISATNPKITILVFGVDDPMYNECMEQTDTKSQNNLMVKFYSHVQGTESCSNPETWNEKEIWITKSTGDGYQPGIIFYYKSEEESSAVTYFDQILSIFKFEDN